MCMSEAHPKQNLLRCLHFREVMAAISPLCAAVWLASTGGCAGDSASSATRGIETAEAYVEGQSTRIGQQREQARLAMIDGSPITMEQLAPALLEVAGAAALEEIVIDMMLAREAERRGVRITEADIDRERERLVASLARADEAADAERGERLLREMRRARGLGAERFRALLRRTALMRALVADDVSVSEAAVRQSYELRHGVRYRARLITVPTAGEAAEARRRLNAGASFGEVAARMSTDVSAARGGLIEEISPADPSYPAAIRSALERLTPGEVSPPVAIGDGFAILLLDSVTAPDRADFEHVRPALESEVRRRQERLLMDRLAERLLEGARVTIFDAGLRRSWEARRAPGTR
ncbi:MAG: peptidylprolyl isomerase [Phycisphaeraceae bacterium]|nr:MAG: peptidylprolyl isomerase [Phycisphaeraceae bacterium]